MFQCLNNMKISVKLHPNAKHEKFEVLAEDAYEVWVTEPAIENRANEALIDILSEHFNCPKSMISIAFGSKSTNKVINIG